MKVHMPFSHQHPKLASVTLALVLSLSGCAWKTYRLYEGKRKPVEEVAVIFADKDYDFGVDQRWISSARWASLFAHNSGVQVHVEPGSHRISSTYSTQGGCGNDCYWKAEGNMDSVEVDLEKGHVYELSADYSGTLPNYPILGIPRAKEWRLCVCEVGADYHDITAGTNYKETPFPLSMACALMIPVCFLCPNMYFYKSLDRQEQTCQCM
jgi:hypothetical protein